MIHPDLHTAASTGDDYTIPDTLAARYGLEPLRSLDDALLDPDLIEKVAVEWVRTHGVLPVRIKGEACVLTADPSNVVPLEDLALLIGEELRPVVAGREMIMHAIELCYFSKEVNPGDFINTMGGRESQGAVPGNSASDLLEVAEEAPVTQLVNLILLQAVKQGASDIHFEPFTDRLRVRYRIDGVLYEQASPPKHLEHTLVSRLKVMARMDIAEKRLPQDGMAKVRVGEREIDIRVSTVPVAEGERVVLRLLDQKAALLPLDVLGMGDNLLAQMSALLEVPHGMIVVAGPTGSGKTTTLYAAIGGLDTTRLNLLTIEDPIEYQLPSIGQIQVKPKIGLTFASGLRHILRQDPDIVLVGETRDLETADIAVRASLTGHLVFTTLHTNDAPGAIIRLIDMGVEPYLVASCLRAVLAQRLVRKLCPDCREKGSFDACDVQGLGDVADRMIEHSVFQPTGCPVCLEGYSGRIGLFELMRMNTHLVEMVRAGGDIDEIRQAAIQNGMRTLLDDGVGKVLKGITSLAELSSVVYA